MLGMKKKAPETKKANEVKMEAVILLDSEEERVGQSSGSKDGGNPCYSHPGGKSDARADNMLSVKKKAPETKEAKKVLTELVKLSDSEEENVDPSHGCKDWGNPCYSHPGGKSVAKPDNMLGMKKAPESKEAKKATKDPNKPKRPPASAFYEKRGRKSAKDPNKPKRPAGAFLLFMEEFRKQFKEEHPCNRTVATEGIAGGGKWKQLSNAEKAPYMAEAKKRMAEYHKNKDAYNKRVAAGSSGEEESYKSMSEVDEEDGDDD
ncbi:high mobility group B protein 2-like [Lycium barbarum]|uniref:high mobility group B protein 2-like n=1 Tax=Lycium barbarum TaxID=112863 RepID=UPI00293F2F72|nr:high mobility group B protein 2-like [Lycium barbarum]